MLISVCVCVAGAGLKKCSAKHKKSKRRHKTSESDSRDPTTVSVEDKISVGEFPGKNQLPVEEFNERVLTIELR